MSDFPSKEELKGAVLGTLVYLFLYIMVLIPFQSFSKFYLFNKKKREAKKEGNQKPSWRAVKYYNSRDLVALCGDRTVGNYVEFAILFLPLLWMHAIFVDPTQSFTISAIYTFSRAIYPILYLHTPLLIWISTAPGYLIYTYLMFELGTKFALA